MKIDGLVPVPLVLDLWSLGHSASDIARRLGLPNGKHVSRIVACAREIGDKRAVLHHASNGRLFGRPGRGGQKIRKGAIRVKGKEAVPLIGQTLCKRGHARTPENIRGRNCKLCARERRKAR